MERDKARIDKQVLVTYASKHGATAEIAEKIGQVFCQAGLRTDVLPVGYVKDLTPYQAVVLGSAVYIGQWRKDAAKFLQIHEILLAQRQVWLFSSGPTGKRDPKKIQKDQRLPESLQPVADRIQPHDIAVFHGNLDMKKLNFIEKTMIKKVNAPPGDFRDWETITTWATGIVEVLEENVK